MYQFFYLIFIEQNNFLYVSLKRFHVGNNYSSNVKYNFKLRQHFFGRNLVLVSSSCSHFQYKRMIRDVDIIFMFLMHTNLDLFVTAARHCQINHTSLNLKAILPEFLFSRIPIGLLSFVNLSCVKSIRFLM